MPTAAAFESVTDEFTFVVGPVLATALCTGVHPAAGLVTEAALTLVGGLLFAAQRAHPARTSPPPAHAREERVSALSVPGRAGPDRGLPRHRLRLRRHAGLAGRVLRGDRRARPERPPVRRLRRRQHARRHRLRRHRLEDRARGAAWSLGYAGLALAASVLWAAHSVLAARPRSACSSACASRPP